MVVGADGRAIVPADVEAVGAVEERRGLVEPALADLFAVGGERDRGPLAHTAPIVGKVGDQRHLASRNRCVGDNLVLGCQDAVVVEDELAAFDRERPAAFHPAEGDQGAVRAALRDLGVGGEAERAVVRVRRDVVDHLGHAGIVGVGGLPGRVIAGAGPHALTGERQRRVPLQWQHVVRGRLGEEEVLEFLQLLRLLLGQVVVLGVVLLEVIQLPWCRERVERAGDSDVRGLPRQDRARAGDPAAVVDGAVGDDLEVLPGAPVGSRGISKGVDHADAIDRLLVETIDDRRLRDAGGFEQGRGDVDDMVELGAHVAARCEPLRPGDDHRVAGAAEVGGDLLGPLEGRVHRPSPTDREVRVGRRPVPLGQMRFAVGVVGRGRIEEAHFVDGAGEAAFGAGAVVADDVEDESIVAIRQRAGIVNHPADLVVDLRREAREDLRLAREHRLLFGREGIPGRDFVRPRREHGVLRNDPQLLLAFEGLLPQRVPPHVELAFEAVAPLGRHVMRGVGGARAVVAEVRLVRGDRRHVANPGDRLVGQIDVEGVIRVADRRLDGSCPFEEQRLPLVDLAADEAVEVVEALSGGPMVERAGRRLLPHRHIVVLAEPGGGIAVELQRPGHRRRGARDDAGVAVVAGGQLVGDRGGHRPTEGAELPEARIVGQDQQDIRRVLGGVTTGAKIGGVGIGDRHPSVPGYRRSGCGKTTCSVWYGGRYGAGVAAAGVASWAAAGPTRPRSPASGAAAARPAAVMSVLRRVARRARRCSCRTGAVGGVVAD